MTAERTGNGDDSRGARSELIALGWRAGIILGAGLTVGLVVNLVRADSVALRPYAPPAMCTAAAMPAVESAVLAPADVAPMCSATDTTIIDTRSAIAYAQGHVAGAVHLPCTAPSDAADTALALIGTSTTIIIYGESTEEALQVASGLLGKSGRTDLQAFVVEGGFAAWQAADQPCASGPCERCSSEFFHDSSR